MACGVHMLKLAPGPWRWRAGATPAGTELKERLAPREGEKEDPKAGQERDEANGCRHQGGGGTYGNRRECTPEGTDGPQNDEKALQDEHGARSLEKAMPNESLWLANE
jgi:hypothetical protein